MHGEKMLGLEIWRRRGLEAFRGGQQQPPPPDAPTAKRIAFSGDGSGNVGMK